VLLLEPAKSWHTRCISYWRDETKQRQQQKQEVSKMNYATNLAEKIQPTEPTVPRPLTPEQKPLAEIVDARDLFAQKRQNHYHEARMRMKGFFDGKVAQLEARRRHAVEPLRTLWIG
jgi:hypothetical protein